METYNPAQLWQDQMSDMDQDMPVTEDPMPLANAPRKVHR
jgi:hypothetical protein